MEVRLGYKQTEVGIIPDEWNALPLGEVLIKGRLGGNYVNQDMETELPLMKMGNLARGCFDLSKVQFIEPGVAPEPIHQLVCGDVLFNTRNTLDLVGKVAIWRDELPVAYYNSNLMRLEFDPEKICSNEYANYALNTESTMSRLRGLATGTTSVAAIYTRDLLKLKIPVPPLSEQHAIATALSDIDALLVALGQLIAKKRDLKQAAMLKLLTGQTRLPGFRDEWAIIRLGSLGTLIKGAGVKKDESFSGDLPCIRYGEIYTHHHDIVRAFYSQISTSVAALATSLKTGDILFAGSGETKKEIGKAVAFIHECEAFAGGDIVILRPVASDAKFLGYYLNSAEVQRQKASLGQGDAVVHISANALASIELAMPSLPEQTAIATVLSDMDAELAALEQRLAKTRTLKQGMMQELLTGRTRLV
ncbi:restriction endonuclease subunit S [uncultured Pseudomonas sp.]|uniref:restriction endonuclease subunit S n=1 Tax=uncultured Pseudomonas sp. TaxID=114707 RepID=UPI0025E30305|nr:restriction endonuclease subunit S [uncultured Pseudomonas sp.]